MRGLLPELPWIPRKWLAPILIGLSILSAGLTLLVMHPSRPPARPAAEPAEAAGKAGRGGTAARVGDDFSLSFRDFEIPPEPESGESAGFHPFRDRYTSWSAEQVDRFWVPLREIAADILARENDEKIERMFQDIP